MLDKDPHGLKVLAINAKVRRAFYCSCTAQWRREFGNRKKMDLMKLTVRALVWSHPRDPSWSSRCSPLNNLHSVLIIISGCLQISWQKNCFTMEISPLDSRKVSNCDVGSPNVFRSQNFLSPFLRNKCPLFSSTGNSDLLSCISV